MKSKKIYFPIFALLFSFLSCSEQTSVQIPTEENKETCYSTVAKFEPDFNLARLEKEVVRNEQSDSISKKTTLKNSIIFYGSSSIVYWHQYLTLDFPNLPVLGHGFGGSTFSELIYYKDRMVNKFNPKTVLIYCENDIFGGKPKSDQQVFADACYLANDIHEITPNAKIYFLSLKHSPSRRSFIARFNNINNMLKKYAASKSFLGYIDINSSMYLSDGKTLDGSIFQQDSLHMNRLGYLRWTNIVKPILEADYKSR